MGLQIKSDASFTDQTLPILNSSGQVVPAPIDGILPSAGALMLIDLSNVRTTDVSFAGASSGLIQNLAWQQAQSMIPSASEATLKAVTAKLFNSGAGLVEITPKKGIHTIVSQTAGAANHGFAINLPDAIKTYLMANTGHSYYVSVWGRTTRVSLDTTQQFTSYAISVSNVNTAKLSYIRTDGIIVNGALGTRFSANDKTLANYIRNGASAGWSGTPPTVLANLYAYFQYGSKDVFSAFDVNKSPSGIFYKIYIEDLTVSGRTYAAVDAIDNSLYTAAFASGGRFNGDTYTDPATIA